MQLPAGDLPALNSNRLLLLIEPPRNATQSNTPDHGWKLFRLHLPLCILAMAFVQAMSRSPFRYRRLEFARQPRYLISSDKHRNRSYVPYALMGMAFGQCSLGLSVGMIRNVICTRLLNGILRTKLTPSHFHSPSSSTCN